MNISMESTYMFIDGWKIYYDLLDRVTLEFKMNNIFKQSNCGANTGVANGTIEGHIGSTIFFF